ncbi:MAG: aminoglycoside phosphotransferase family protein [Chloroflexota bacterium]
MTDLTQNITSAALINDPPPWTFSMAQLTAGLRRQTGDPKLNVVEITDGEITQRRPTTGKIRGLDVRAESASGEYQFSFVLKESQGGTRIGTAGMGLREVSIYRKLSEQLPMQIPHMLAYNPDGKWLIIERMPPGRRPEKWQAPEYLLAIDQLVALHDRFWGLDEVLNVYQWLARPLTSDLPIHKAAANHGMQKLKNLLPGTMLSNDTELFSLMNLLISNIEKISDHLLETPQTLIHGDYWPGNIHVLGANSLTVFDWENTAIGSGILDLVYFVQFSRWHFEPLPVQEEEIVSHYRNRLALTNDHTWTEEKWAKDWDYALIWIFLTHWLDLLAAIPNSVLTARLPQLEGIWLSPVRDAAARWFSPNNCK